MSSTRSEELIREYPISLWVTGFIFFGGGIYFFLRSQALPVLIGGVGIGLLLVVLSRVLVVELTDSGRTLILRHTGLLRRDEAALDVEEIQSVFVQQSSNRDRDSSPTYRVVIAMQDGSIFPLRSYYSSGYQGKERTASKLRLAVGVQGQDQSPRGILSQVSDYVQDIYATDASLLESLEEQETNGVRWRMQTVAFGSAPVTRWLSKDVVFAEQFLYLVQKMEDQDSGSRVMSLMGKTLMRQSLSLYGFTDENLPNFETAEVLTGLDKRLDRHYMGYCSDPSWSRHLLNAWVVMPLIGWAQDHPIAQNVRQPENFSQLAVLFSPKGVYVSCLGELNEMETEQLVDLGVEIVRALGG